MLKYTLIEFSFPLSLSEKKKVEDHFILEGFAAANDFDFQNDIISDSALRRAVKNFLEKGKVCLNHNKGEIGKLLDCHFEKGKIWVKMEITEPEIIKKIKSGELNCLSVKGKVHYRTFERVFFPESSFISKVVDDLDLEEVSLVPQGANPEAKAIRWYIKKAVELAEKNMSKKIIKEKKSKKEEIELEEVEEEKEEEKPEEKEEEKIEEEKKEEIKEEESEEESEGETEEKTDLGCSCEEKKEEKAEEKDEETEKEEEKEEETEEEEKEETELSEKKEEKIVYQVMNSGDVELEEKKDLSEFKKELLRTGSWKHSASKDGMLNVTKDMLKTIVKNFKDKVLDNVFVPLGHPTNDDPSSNVGEVVDLAIEDDKLMATIDVKDETIVSKIKKGLIKGISASLAENYTKKDTGEKVGTTLFHAALVGEPYIKGMGSFATIPLSEEWKDSKIIQIVNLEEVLTLDEMSKRLDKLEKRLKLSEEDETSEEETKEGDSKEDESKSEEEESSKEETSEEEESESSNLGEKTEEEEEKESETEESETEETESEAEEADEGVELAEAEKMFGELLQEGKVTPAERELLVPLLASGTTIELSEGKKVASGKALFEYLKDQSPKFSLSEEGTSETPEKKDKKEKEEEIPEEISQELDKMNFTENKGEIYKEFKEMKEKKESTPF